MSAPRNAIRSRKRDEILDTGMLRYVLENEVTSNKQALAVTVIEH